MAQRTGGGEIGAEPAIDPLDTATVLGIDIVQQGLQRCEVPVCLRVGGPVRYQK